MGNPAFEKIENAFEQLQSAMYNLQEVVQEHSFACFQVPGRKGTQAAWDDHVAMRQLNKEFRDRMIIISKIVRTEYEKAEKPKRTWAGRYATEQAAKQARRRA